MTKRIVYTKDFERAKELDFEDDGNHFRGYKYKGILPISHLNTDGDAFIRIRLDYMGIDYELYKEDYDIIDEFNYVPSESVDMEKLAQNCEYLLNKYVNNPEMVALNKEIKREKAIKGAERYVDSCTYKVLVAEENIAFLQKKRELAERYNEFFSEWDMKKAITARDEAYDKLINAKGRLEELKMGVA